MRWVPSAMRDSSQDRLVIAAVDTPEPTNIHRWPRGEPRPSGGRLEPTVERSMHGTSRVPAQARLQSYAGAAGQESRGRPGPASAHSPSSSRSTRRAVSTTTFASSSTAPSRAGRCPGAEPRPRRQAPRHARRGSPAGIRRLRGHDSRRANTVAARCSCGTAAPGSRSVIRARDTGRAISSSPSRATSCRARGPSYGSAGESGATTGEAGS